MRLQLLALSALLCSLPAFAGADKTIYGLYENVSMPGLDLQVKAKLDTGAQTASLSARDIERFERDGERWVRFYLAIDDAHEHPIERPLQRVSRIKRRASDFDPEEEKRYSTRPVIDLRVCMGKRLRVIEVNLTDRSAFSYPLLIGSAALEDFGALVDPSLEFASGQPDCADEDA